LRQHGSRDHAVVVRLSRFDHFGVYLAVARRHTVVGGALEHDELLGLLRNFGNALAICSSNPFWTTDEIDPRSFEGESRCAFATREPPRLLQAAQPKAEHEGRE
jgi:hypothetical protein